MPRKRASHNDGLEFDLHIWIHPETRDITTTYTISEGKYAFAYEMPLEQALEAIARHLVDKTE